MDYLGGAGYVLNKLALQAIIPYLYNTTSPMCFPTDHKSIEDVFLGYCLGELDIYPVETRDEQYKPRFHWTSPEGTYLLNEESYLLESRREVFGVPLLAKENCCSKYSISFQNLKPALRMEQFDRALYA